MSRRSLVLLALFALLSVVEITSLRGLRTLDLRLSDALLRQQAYSRPPSAEILLLAIDEHSLDALADAAGRYPWPRSVHADVLAYLDRQGAAAVVFDILFSDPDIDRPDADRYFIEVVQRTARAYFPLVLLDGAAQGLNLDRWGEALGFARQGDAAGSRAGVVLPLRPLALTGRIGSINYRPDTDGVGRHAVVRSAVGGWSVPSLPARVAGDLGTVLPAADRVRINWRGAPEDRPTLPYADVHADAERRAPRLDPALFRDRIVVVGATAPALGDLRRTPMAELHPGSDILAAAIETLRAGDWLRSADGIYPLGLSLLLIGLLALAMQLLASPVWVGVLLTLLTAMLLAAAYSLLALRWWLPVATPLLLAWLFYLALALEAWLRERQQRARAIRMFGRFVDPRVVGELIASEGPAGAQVGSRRRITLLFSDIRGFTTLSESRTPEEIVALLNRYFSRQVDVIFRHGGTMDKFIGDAIMAFWGAPLDDPDQAANAVAAALEMSRVVDEMRGELGEAGRDFDIGIGIHTGEAVVGFIGAEHRLEYTAIGDTVNLASRIEGLTKGRARVLVSETTRAACGEAFEFASRGTHQVKGRAAEVVLWEPVKGVR